LDVDFSDSDLFWVFQGMDSDLFGGFLDYSLVFKGLVSWLFEGWICLVLRIRISFVADTKMKKT
jgi:hypothetical protein